MIIKNYTQFITENITDDYKSYSEIIAENLSKELLSRGLSEDMVRFSVSKTDYGCSCYMNITDDIKIRISDHSVENRDRMSNYIHINWDDDISKKADNIERLIFPDRFEFITGSVVTHVKNGVRGTYIRK